MHRIVIDTNLFIDWLNDGKYGEIFFQREAVKFLSAVVMMELHTGARSRKDRRVLDGVTATFAKADRILLPSQTVYRESGQVLSDLMPSQLNKAALLTNDILIALSARSIGATVLTKNGRDFLAIQHVRPFRLHVVT